MNISRKDRYRSGAHTVLELKYHFVWKTKYGYNVLGKEVALRLRDLVKQICSEKSIEVVRGNVRSNHVHILVSAPSDMSPAKIVLYLKGKSSYRLMREFPELKKRYWGSHLWSRGYFCCTVGAVTEEMVKKYIEDQSDAPQGFKVWDEEVNKSPSESSAAGLISGWVENLIPKSQKLGSEYVYPTPPNATWGEITFEFTADEVINVSCRGKIVRTEQENFRMKNQNTKRPTAQWAIFKALAMAGEFGWQDNHNNRSKVTKQKEAFSKKLKATFGLSDDPLEFVTSEHVYKPKFIISGKETLEVYKKQQRLA
jgi:putative transposase